VTPPDATGCLTTEVVEAYGIRGIGIGEGRCQNAFTGIVLGKCFKANHSESSGYIGLAEFFGLTASDVQLGAALPDKNSALQFPTEKLLSHGIHKLLTAAQSARVSASINLHKKIVAPVTFSGAGRITV
jgi:hypothetical protein